MIVTFIGHRKIPDELDLKSKLKKIVLHLVDYKNADTFLFGSGSSFNDLCINIVSEIKQIRPHIRRIYVRAEFTDISEDYERYLLSIFDETFFPENVKNAGKASYIKRNFDMIDKADICVFYYNDKYVPQSKSSSEMLSHNSMSGTKIAYEYAQAHSKSVINLYSRTHEHINSTFKK